MLTKNTAFLVNPTGRFVVGGPQGDTGLTGPQDHRGQLRRHGPSRRRRFSGKDPSKVDRSAAYMGRYVAKNIVAAGLATSAEIQFAYAIGYPDPVSVCVNTFGTGIVSDEEHGAGGQRSVQLQAGRTSSSSSTCSARFTPRPPTTATSARHDPDITWEKTDKAEALRKAATKSAPAVAPATLRKAAGLVNGRAACPPASQRLNNTHSANDQSYACNHQKQRKEGRAG